MKVEDRHISEALRLGGFQTLGPEHVRECRNDNLSKVWQTAEYIAKLECAVEALDNIANNYNGYAISLAAEALTQIRSESHE